MSEATCSTIALFIKKVENMLFVQNQAFLSLKLNI